MESMPQAEGYRVKPLVTSAHELSVQSLLDGCLPGTILVNDRQHPTAALIRTSECNLVAGTPDDAFMAALSSELDFWDTITPDSQAWFEKIPAFHPNPYVRPFQRRRYELAPDAFRPRERALPEGFSLERADLANLRNAPLRNANDVLEWAGAWGDDALFDGRGAGCLIRNAEAVVGWSLSDCYCGDKIAVGVRTDRRFRRMGFGIRVVSETVQQCFEKGYRSVD
ncbi:MAG TPA: GNAT family N-acetyltransferase, partial [Clostridia bacterium]|nr:GNAT family N-acetyltransferase [Clostridia bacterium]